MENVELRVQGMTCGGCVASVQKALLAVPGVSAARADLQAARVAVDYDPARVDRPALRAAIEAAGFDVPA